MALNSSGFTALGPAPLQMTGCFLCYDYTKTEGRVNAIAVDPTNPNHIYIGTDVARHGASSVNGGRFTPPDAPIIGLYESNDGGASFKLVFSKTGDQLGFAELSDLYGSGFIVQGNRIIGKAARCTIEATKQSADGLELSTGCATSIMRQNVKFSLKIVDDNTIDRIVEEIPGMVIRYARCRK